MKKNIEINFESVVGLIPAGCFIGVITSVGSAAVNIVNHNQSGVINCIILGIVSIALMVIFSKKIKNQFN